MRSGWEYIRICTGPLQPTDLAAALHHEFSLYQPDVSRIHSRERINGFQGISHLGGFRYGYETFAVLFPAFLSMPGCPEDRTYADMAVRQGVFDTRRYTRQVAIDTAFHITNAVSKSFGYFIGSGWPDIPEIEARKFEVFAEWAGYIDEVLAGQAS